MAEKKDKTLAYGLLAIGVAVGAYAMFGGKQTTPYGPNTQLPPGGTLQTQWGTWSNNTGAPVAVTTTGMVIDSAGKLLGSIADIIKAVNTSKGTNSDSSDGSTVMLGVKGVNNNAGAYYNPLPGGLM